MQKLKLAQVKMIKRMLATGKVNQSAIARKYKVTPALVSFIKYNRVHADVPPKLRKPRAKRKMKKAKAA